ncbi:MAG: ATP-binding cassette domain-containing protein [Phycisphaerae bacterium]|nr:ATP-binding cassette domain-containing protein [Phycisphaerae bacterium]
MATTSDSVVQTVGLTKIFRDFWMREKVTAVSDLNLNIAPREVFGLLGPNGSGKSTTLKMILGLLFPTKGRITIFGKVPTNVAVKARIGFLPEESNLYNFLDARETLDFYGRLFHIPRAQRIKRIDMLLEMVGLKGAAYRRVGEYSKGMQRRIGLAQALINDPDLLILDEPTSGLDPIGTRQFKDLIRTLVHRGKSIILSSHLLGDVEDVCDNVCILYGGKLQTQGKIDELLSRKELTQITTDKLDDATLATIRQTLEKAGRELVEVGSPHDKLENLFLRIVEDAQRHHLATGGALGGAGVAEFLTRDGAQPEGAAVIESLVAKPEKKTEQPEPISPQPEQVEPKTQVLQELLTKPQQDAAPPTPTNKPTAKPTVKPSQTQADRSVIDDLLGNDKESGE